MRRIFMTLGASAVALGALISNVGAKTVFYDINGQRYSYDTNNRRQTAVARKVMEAAKAADAAKARAAAERASNPLVAVFGSQTQREAEAAQAQLNQIIAEQEQVAAVSKRQRPVQVAKDQDVAKPAAEPAGKQTRVEEPEQAAAIGTAAGQPLTLDVSGPAGAARADRTPKAAIRSVTLDAETGIKTIIRADGSIHEELFDPGILSRLELENHSATFVSNASGINQKPQEIPADATGSISIRETTLGLRLDADQGGASLAN